ncbi:DUF2117 domain-containing protein [Methanofervidicoccus abyssi]|uniref:DUF2117 domain-containing protein n=1 Tax=Methanofervidicoccus abyssi TaxID=2082189 RepID=A0A401HRU9_9EURY|nr:DUF2117 domain-containing protein [Methanofervidicoccus abyssi]GBF36920.1 hypothetical protein MHHB_P1150 [Methanofervidicoccus abyssi]
MGINIGVVVHGPRIVDSGYAERILDILREFSEIYDVDIEVTAKVGGNMGRVAVIDRGLEDVIDISERLYPSQCLRRLKDRDILLLLNYGKSKETGHTFGRMVVKRAEIDKPVIQIERPGEKDGSILVWNREYCSEDIKKILATLVSYISERLGLEVEKCVEGRLSVWEKGNKVFRRIDTVDPGEDILVNGIVVGRVLKSPVVLISEMGKIVEIINGEIKKDGVERLRYVDLKNAIVKTGVLRKGSFRDIDRKKFTSDNLLGDILIVDRGDIDILGELKNKNISTVIAIGSDTTLILGSILSRFSVKVVGIVDKDIYRHKLVEDMRLTEGSKIFLVKNWRCSKVGKLLMEHLKGRKLNYDCILKYVIDLLKKYKVDYEILNF